MVSPLTRSETHRAETRVTPRAAVGSVTHGDQPTLVEDDRFVLALVGLVHLDEPGKIASASTLLQRYKEAGEGSLYGLNGTYVVAILDKRAEEWTIVNDRYGYRKLYYWSSSDAVFFSSECKSFLWHPEFSFAVDEVALANMIRIGLQLGGRTLFQGVHMLPPASVMTVGASGLKIRHYSSLDVEMVDSERVDFNEMASELAERIRTAVRRRVVPDTCLLVTGGLDSRILAAALQQVSRPDWITTVTVGQPGCNEVQLGRQIARASNFSHQSLPLFPDFIPKYADAGMERTEGNMSCHTYFILAADEFLRGTPTRAVMSGVLGNGFSGRHWPAQLVAERTEAVAIQQICGGPRKAELVSRLFKPDVYRRIKGETERTLERLFEEMPTSDVLKKYDHYYMFGAARRRAKYDLELLGEHVDVLDPFEDNDLVDFAFRLPTEVRVGSKLYRRMLIQEFNRVSHVTHTSTGRPIFADTVADSGSVQNLTQRLRTFRARSGQLARRLMTGGKLANPISYQDALRSGSRDFLLENVLAGDYLEDLFDMDALRDLVDSHMSGRENHMHALCMIATFSLWRRRFCSSVEADASRAAGWTA
jgi:asparagine synthase (glutamine-hydrolysing)